MEFRTSISKVIEDDVIIRGNKLSSLIQNNSFTDVAFLLLTNRFPNLTESKIFSAILTSIIDHGMGTASSLTTRFVMSTGNSLNSAISAGILALGEYHGGAIEKSMKQLLLIKNNNLNINNFVRENLENKKVIFGFGHKFHKYEDPRVIQIILLCNKLKFKSDYIDISKNIEKELENIKGKKICLNIDGLIAAILLEMKFKPEIGNGIFIIGRVPGLIAQALEEKEKEKTIRRIEEGEIKYNPY